MSRAAVFWQTRLHVELGRKEIMKAFYFCDPMGDWVWERREIQETIYNATKKTLEIKYTERFPLLDDTYFDVLFFDWGGMSIGNSLLESYIRHLLKDAENHPGRFYVMTSRFTAEAMKDAMNEMVDKPANIFLDIKGVIPYLKFESAEA